MDQQTLNTEAAVDAAVLSDSSPDTEETPNAAPAATETPAEALNTDTDADAKQPAGPAKEAAAAGEDRLDQHPRFQELVTAKNTLKADLEATRRELAEFKSQQQHKTEQAEQAGRPDFDAAHQKLENQLEEGELSLAEFNRAVRTLHDQQREAEREALLAELQQREQTKELQSQFLAKYPFLNQIWEQQAEQVEALKRENPVHDNLSAALALRLAETERTRETAIAEAVAKKEAEVIANFQAKQSARALGGGARTTADPQGDAELQATGHKGGLLATLAGRLERNRQRA